jgi:hypothetical protein
MTDEAKGVKLTEEPDYPAEMRLAAGVTCDDCAHSRRCFAFGFSTPGRTSCDFWPSRYVVGRHALSQEGGKQGQLQVEIPE